MGEGNFHVKKDQKHPFIVKTSSLKIKVLGTKFNVCAYGNEDKTVTTLESGSVMIQKPTEEPITVLSPNEQLEYHNTTCFHLFRMDQRRVEFCIPILKRNRQIIRTDL